MGKKKNLVKYIDLEKNIAESDSAFLKILPKFIINIFKLIVKQDSINAVLNAHDEVEGLDFLEAMLDDFNLTLVINGKDNLPENGRCFFAANHPFGILDGLILTHTVASKYGQITAIANDAFMLIPQLRPIITEVNVYGSSSKDRVTALNKMYESDLPITHFPAGEVSRFYNKKVQDAPWQKSFIKKSIATNRSIVPIYFEGTNSRLFYAVFILRKALRIKMNVELMLLPRELFRARNKTIKVNIGEPMSPETFNRKQSHEYWAQYVRNGVYNLA